MCLPKYFLQIQKSLFLNSSAANFALSATWPQPFVHNTSYIQMRIKYELSPHFKLCDLDGDLICNNKDHELCSTLLSNLKEHKKHAILSASMY